jgi:hypothetical protein
MTRLKLAELTSGVGGPVLGVGLGAAFPGWFGPIAGMVAIVGLSLHALRHVGQALNGSSARDLGLSGALAIGL